MLSRGFVDMALLRGFVGTAAPLFVNMSPFLVFVEGAVPKRVVGWRHSRDLQQWRDFWP